MNEFMYWLDFANRMSNVIIEYPYTKHGSYRLDRSSAQSGDEASQRFHWSALRAMLHLGSIPPIMFYISFLIACFFEFW